MGHGNLGGTAHEAWQGQTGGVGMVSMPDTRRRWKETLDERAWRVSGLERKERRSATGRPVGLVCWAMGQWCWGFGRATRGDDWQVGTTCQRKRDGRARAYAALLLSGPSARGS